MPARLLRAAALALAALACAPVLGAPAAPPPSSVPAPPYFSIQLASAPGRAQALAGMKPYVNERHVRAELRKTGWQIRVGVYPQRKDAEAALEAFVARGAKGARVLAMETAVPWLLPDGKTLPVAVAKPRPPAPAAPAATTAAPAAAAPLVAAPQAPVAVPAPPLRPSTPQSPVRYSDRFARAAQRYDTETRRLLRTGGAARRDGFLYAMDVAPLLLYAAERRDQTLYLQLLPEARQLVLPATSGSFVEGFVLWRRKDGVKPEVSGATEAGWMARALWAGASAFNRAEDRALASKILDGYARHAFEQNSVWFVRKYFAFEANVFANLSVLGNYQPDFMTEAEREAGSPAWRGMAERAYALLERAQARSGLLNPLIVPEIGATYPGQSVDVFAPNNLAALEDSCDAAEASVRGLPKLARGVLKFAGGRGHRNAFGRLHAYYDAVEGDPRGDQSLSTTGYACLGRIAAQLGDDDAWEDLESQLAADMETPPTLALSNDSPLYSAGPLLLTALAAGALAP